VTVSDAVVGVRVPIVARLGTSVWARFHVDVVADGIQMTGAPDPVPTLTGMDFAGLVRHEYLAYPSVDHIADKACAILERYGPLARPSTRYKDLIDLSCLVMH
jgi:hypothetical protein